MNPPKPTPTTTPSLEIALNRSGKPRKRKAGGGRPRKVAGRRRVHFSASLDSVAVVEIMRRASLAGLTPNDYLSALFEPEGDVLPVASDLT